MRQNILKVIEAFKVNKKAKGDSKGTCSTDGTFIWSYNMVIAMRLNDEVIVCPYKLCPSVTTRAQHRAIMSSIPGVKELTEAQWSTLGLRATQANEVLQERHLRGWQ